MIWVALDHKEMEEEPHGWHTFIVLTPMLEDIDEHATHYVQLGNNNYQIIQDVNLKVVKRKAKAY